MCFGMRRVGVSVLRGSGARKVCQIYIINNNILLKRNVAIRLVHSPPYPRDDDAESRTRIRVRATYA